MDFWDGFRWRFLFDLSFSIDEPFDANAAATTIDIVLMLFINTLEHVVNNVVVIDYCNVCAYWNGISLISDVFLKNKSLIWMIFRCYFWIACFDAIFQLSYWLCWGFPRCFLNGLDIFHWNEWKRMEVLSLAHAFKDVTSLWLFVLVNACTSHFIGIATNFYCFLLFHIACCYWL